MEPLSDPATGAPAPGLRPAIRRRFLQLGLQQLVVGALLFGCAGTLLWWQGWLYLALSLGMMAAIGAWVLPRNPEVIAARARGAGAGTKPFDRVFAVLYAIGTLAVFVAGALEARSGALLGWPFSLAGALLVAAATVPIAGAMAVNRNLETSVRIQTDRGHRVATGGPYRVVRHPMYAASLLQYPGIALTLGSAQALWPALACAVLIVVRTALEDRTLQRELPGYAEFARQTRWRLLPGVW